MLFDRIRRAPEFPADSVRLNTRNNVSIERLKGHITILDFWTYCCINCMHILPDLEYIEEKYKKKPVVVIGVHSAKFEEETNSSNIEQAISRYEIKHPVIVDEGMKIWNAYGVNSWPTIIVIDPEGRIVYNQSGEGQRDNLIEVVDTLLENYQNKGILAKRKIIMHRPKNTNKSVLSYPGKISFSPDAKEFAVSDSNHNRILIAKTDGIIERVIGSGKRGYENGDFASASFNRPQGVLWSSDKNFVYVADTENHLIRLIDLNEEKVSIIAGTGKQSIWPSGGKPRETALSSPWDLTELNGLIYIAMAGLHQIWVYDPKSDDMRPFAGNSGENIIDGNLSSCSFAQPSGIVELDGDLYIADSEVSGVRKINMRSEQVSTISGRGLFDFGLKDGSARESLFQHPLGIGANRNLLFVADTYNNAVRQIDLKSVEVTTIIHKKEGVCMIGDENCDQLGLWEPSDVKCFNRTLYIADTNNHLIRTFDLNTKKLKTLELREKK